MIDSDKTKGSAIADSNSARGMTSLLCIVKNAKCNFCEEGKCVLQRESKRNFVREQEMEVRKENSRLNLQNYAFLLSGEREI